MKGKHKSKAVLLILATVLVLVGVLSAVYFMDHPAEEPAQRGELSSGFGQLERVEYNGKTYVHKPDITTLLIMGIDRETGTEQKGYRDGGQADFLQLLIFDHGAKVIKRLSIDRDTMTEITILSVLGKPVETKKDHISLSHGFGKTSEEQCGYTMEAVARLLQGESIDLYIALNMDAVPVFNDVLGGVEVEFTSDMSDIDPAMVKGAKVKLSGDQAYALVHSRMTVGDGTNAYRMKRQSLFLSAAEGQLKKKISADTGFVGTLYDALDKYMASNASRGRLINEANRAYKYRIDPVTTFAGEYGKDEDGFTAFYPDETSITNWVLDTFYDLEA